MKEENLKIDHIKSYHKPQTNIINTPMQGIFNDGQPEGNKITLKRKISKGDYRKDDVWKAEEIYISTYYS